LPYARIARFALAAIGAALPKALKVNVVNSIMWRPQLDHRPVTLLCYANAT
jgi:hypothetical protein